MLLREIDAGIVWVEAAIDDLDQEAVQHRHRLEQLSGATQLLANAGLTDEATAMDGGRQTIETALVENERRRMELADVGRQLLVAREQVAPVWDSGRQYQALKLRLEAAARSPVLLPESAIPSPDTYEDDILAHPATQPDEEPPRISAPATVSDEAVPVAEATFEPEATPGPALLQPITATPQVTEIEVSPLPVAVPASAAAPRRSKRPLLVVAGAFLLMLLASGTVLATSMLGDDDDSSAQPAATSSDPSSAAIAPSSTAAQTTVASASPTPPLPASTAAQSPAIVAPLATVPPTPTAVPSTEPTATVPAAIPLEAVVDRVIDAETALRSGQIDASVEYQDGSRSSSTIRFDLGESGDPARIAITTTYQSGEQQRTTEQIMVGGQVWERIDGADWQEASNAEGAWGQVQAFLPRLASVPDPQRASDERPGELTWYDALRDADVTLQVNPESGQPERFQSVSRGTGSVLTVTYTGWNTPTTIDPPIT